MNGTLFSSEGALLFVIFGVVALGLWLAATFMGQIYCNRRETYGYI